MRQLTSHVSLTGEDDDFNFGHQQSIIVRIYDAFVGSCCTGLCPQVDGN